jgi:PE family
MADQLPQLPPELGAITGISGLAAIVQIAEEIAHEVQVMGGGKYAFQPDELRSVLAQWQSLQQTVETAMGHVGNKTPHNSAVLAPGNEVASDAAANAAHTTNTAYQAYLKSMDAYIKGYVKDLQGVLDNYMGTESANTDLATGARNSMQA